VTVIEIFFCATQFVWKITYEAILMEYFWTSVSMTAKETISFC